ncbi:MAG: hypothetical protein ACLQVN_07520 [Bryobacteraceae bacterium]
MKRTLFPLAAGGSIHLASHLKLPFDSGVTTALPGQGRRFW